MSFLTKINLFIQESIQVTKSVDDQTNSMRNVENSDADSWTYLTKPEFILSISVLLFAIIVLVILSRLIKKNAFYKDQSMRLMVLTLVIAASLFVVTASFDLEQTTPIIGLLGTIVGYLLGASPSKSNKHPKTPNNDNVS